MLAEANAIAGMRNHQQATSTDPAAPSVQHPEEAAGRAHRAPAVLAHVAVVVQAKAAVGAGVGPGRPPAGPSMGALVVGPQCLHRLLHQGLKLVLVHLLVGQVQLHLQCHSRQASGRLISRCAIEVLLNSQVLQLTEDDQQWYAAVTGLVYLAVPPQTAES
jgi:hypothetical protein